MAGKPRKKRQTISRAAAIEASLSILDQEGLDALSIRRLAAELGVGAMTLYGYFKNKEELLDQIVAHVVGNIREPRSPKGSWEERLTRIMKRLHDALLHHPGIPSLVFSRPNPIPALDPFREAVLRILHEGGFSVQEAVNALTTLATYVAGYSILEHSRTGAQAENERLRIAQLPEDEFPNLLASSKYYAVQVSKKGFDIGLYSLIQGLALRISSPASY